MSAMTLAWPVNLAGSLLLATIRPISLIVTSQNCVLVGAVQVLVASPNGSPGSWVLLLSVSAYAWIVSVPGSVAMKQNPAWPFASVGADPLAGLACVVTAVG